MKVYLIVEGLEEKFWLTTGFTTKEAAIKHVAARKEELNKYSKDCKKLSPYTHWIDWEEFDINEE